MRLMKGLTIASIKKHPSLIPLFFFVGSGCLFAGLYTLRLCLYSPDVSIDRKNNPFPYLKWDPTHQYKLYSPIRDYSKEEFPKERPKID
ncbi:hypothetical protein CHS0354_023251 [Potamilus streckersoni]|uniref:Cytochrome c oxidase subunit NDUFA4 n=1 Tax=Potamilus streckersoni TaxID=2493646 RepID=A0AAE0S3B5_9BIVA|nr:hypothetical protein CHS0354_023251 [Potamilus streckersoni]